LAPGSVEASILRDAVAIDRETLAAVRARYHLDDPFLVQFVSWLGNAVQLDFGTSLRTGESVSTMLADRAPITLELMAMAFVITLVLGLPLGVLAATRAGSAIDRGTVAFSIVGVSAPAFVTGLFFLWLFGLELGWFPIFDVGEGIADRVYHLLLPALTLAFGMLSLIVKVTRAAMIDTLQQDYYAFARARGVAKPRALRRYALRNAAIPVVTASGLLIGAMVGGSVLVEVTFSLPGLGSLLVDSINFEDLPVVQAVALTIAAVILLVNLLTDLAYRCVDPRIRLGGAAA